MKKGFFAFLTAFLLLALTGCARTYADPEALIEIVLAEIPIAEAEKTEIHYAGMNTVDEHALLWYFSGNEHQAHTYLAIECTKTDKDEYAFIRAYDPRVRYEDICLTEWQGGYAFCVNNPRCKVIRVTDNAGVHETAIDSYPFVFFNKLLPVEYVFLDADGNAI